MLKKFVILALQLAALYHIGWWAHDIRMHAINVYGMVIHEFDPWFNFRATQYLADHGLKEFFHWYDYMSWSPLGRPVGTTIYPGMQMVSVFLWNTFNHLGYSISLNDVCCMVPVWFGVMCTMLLGALTWVASGSRNAAVAAAAIMSILPAHLMRSVGGGFDNESVAISCLVGTFLMWSYSLSGKDDDRFSLIGIATGLSYTCMVASWGGFVFVLNMIGIHAFVLLLLGRFTNKLYWSYTLWYIVGTFGATRVPVVGLTPLKSLEQLAPMGVFGVFQLLKICDHPKVLKFFKVDKATMTKAQKWKVITQVFTIAAVIGGVIAMQLWNAGYFGPLSSRVRGLFVKHTHTGNPLVDSVAEHQPAKPENFYQFMHYVCYIAPIGFVIAVYKSVIIPFFRPKQADQESTDPLLFLVVYACVTYYFALKMNRLMLLMGPVSAALGGIALSSMGDFVIEEGSKMLGYEASKADETAATPTAAGEASEKTTAAATPSGKSNKKNKGSASVSNADRSFADIFSELGTQLNGLVFVQIVRKMVAVAIVYALWGYTPDFMQYTQDMMYGLSNPSLMFQARLNDGTEIIVDDYREAYHWLRDTTPEDSRVMAWWDYGYQITGIANRTSIADGNTWNHEHIALLGRCLTSPEEKAHKIIKHLADYVLIWAGGGGDDLAKSPHMARIGNSVYHDICPGDPTCRSYGFINYQQMIPTPFMAASLLFKLHRNRISPDVSVDPKLFKEVFMSKYGKVRIYQVMGVSKKSKEWAANATNKICDAPGSWYCSGQYPPVLQKSLLSKAKAFEQLEDFNKKKEKTEDKKSQKKKASNDNEF